jgi:UDP-glucose 4-epimerase
MLTILIFHLIGGSLKKNNSILITGGAGFLGSHIVDSFVKKNLKVTVIDNLSTTTSSAFVNPKAELIEMDINDKNLKKIIQSLNPKIILHAASQISVSISSRFPMEDAKNNIIGSLNLLESITDFQKCYFIFISSGGAIYGENLESPVKETQLCCPKSPYGLSKLTVENYMKYFSESRNLNHLIVRPANIFGPRQNPNGESGVVSIFANSMLKNQKVSIFGDGHDFRDYVYVKDVVNFVDQAIEKRVSGVFNVGTGLSVTTNKVFSDLAKILDYKKNPDYLPNRPGDIKGIRLDSTKALKEINWNPKTNFTQGLEETITFFKSDTLN